MKNTLKFLAYLNTLLNTHQNVGFIWLGKNSEVKLNKLGKTIFPEGITRRQKTKCILAQNVSKHFEKAGEPLKNIGTWGEKAGKFKVSHKGNLYLELFSLWNKYEYICNDTGEVLNYFDISEYMYKSGKTAHRYRRFKVDENLTFVSFKGKRFE